MAILSWPSEAELDPPSSYQLALVANTQTSDPSPWTGAVQTLEMPGARWSATLSWTDLEEAHWRVLCSFVAELAGQAGRFTWSPPAWRRRATMQPTDPAGPVVASNSYGKAIITQGWNVASGQWSFMKGDLLGWVDSAGRPQMHMAVETIAPNLAGVNAMRLTPAIRRPVAAGTRVNIHDPSGVFRLTKDVNPFDFQGSTVRSNVTLSIEEAIF